MNKTIYEYPIDTEERIAECSSCGKKYAPTLDYVTFDFEADNENHDQYAACPKCGHRSEWFKKQTRDLTIEEREAWIADGKRDPIEKAFRDAFCWKKYSPEEIAKHAAIKKKYFLGMAVILIILFSYAGYVLF